MVGLSVGMLDGQALEGSSELSLSVVDQSPVRKGGTARDALTETIELARAVERG